MTELPKAYTPRDVEGAIYERWLAADVFAPDGAGLDRRSGPAPVHDHPAAAQRDGLAPSRSCPADGGRGPDGPPRPDARPRDALPARARPRQHRRPVRPRRDPRQGRGEPPVARSGALPRADGRVLGLDQAGDARPAAAGRRVGRLGPAALHDGRRLGAGRAGRLRAALPRRPGVSDRGARQLVPGLPDERVRPRGHPDRDDRHAVVRPLPPHRRGDRSAGPGRDDHRGDDPPGDDPRRHRGRRPSRRRALRGRWSGAASGSRSWIATCRSSPTTSSSGRSGPARSRSRRPTTRPTTPPACATACRCRPSWPTTRPSPGPAPPYDGLDRYEARRQMVADLAERGDLEASGRTRWSSGAASAATTSSSRASRPSGSSARSRSRRARSTRPAAGGSGSCPSGSRRPGSTG